MMDYESEQQLAYTTAQLLRAAMWAGGLNLLLVLTVALGGWGASAYLRQLLSCRGELVPILAESWQRPLTAADLEEWIAQAAPADEAPAAN